MSIFFYLIIFIICLVICTSIIDFKKYTKFSVLFFFFVFSLCSITYFFIGSKDFFSFEQKLKEDLKSEKDLDPKKLILFLESQLKDNPEDLEGWKILARTCLFAGYIQKANLYYNRALKYFPDDLSLIKEYAFFKRENQEINQAIKLAEKAKELDKEDIENLKFLIELYIEIDEKTRAKEEVELLRSKNIDTKIIDEFNRKIDN